MKKHSTVSPQFSTTEQGRRKTDRRPAPMPTGTQRKTS